MILIMTFIFKNSVFTDDAVAYRHVQHPLPVIQQCDWNRLSIRKWPEGGLIVSANDDTFQNVAAEPSIDLTGPLPRSVVQTPLRLACRAVRESPSHIWEDVKSSPLVSAGMLIGLCGISFSGMMETIGPWIFAGGSLTASWMLLRGGAGLFRASRTQNQTAAIESSRDFGIGAFSLATMGLSAGLLAGLRHCGILHEEGGELGGLLQAAAAVLHSSDEIAMGLVIARKFLGGQRRQNDNA